MSNDYNALFQQFRNNPIDFMIRSKLNIPINTSDPRQIVEHLAITNQIPMQMRSQVNQMLGKY